MLTKRCAKCGQEKLTSEFHVNAARKDGLCNWCKACRNKTDRRRPHYPGDTVRTKTCRKCGLVKPRAAFSRDGDRLDQRRSYCKQCDRVYALRYQECRQAAIKNALVAHTAGDHAPV